MELRPAFQWIYQALQGLSAIHYAKIVHRDLKPGNIFVVRDGPTKILDFGIGRARAVVPTTTREVRGTPDFIAPEQMLGEEVDGRADVYSIGCVLFWLLSQGRTPFLRPGEDSLPMNETVARHLEAQPTPLRTWVPDVPITVEAFVRTLLSRERRDRLDARDAIHELETIARVEGLELFAMPTGISFSSSKEDLSRLIGARETEETRAGPPPTYAHVIVRDEPAAPSVPAEGEERAAAAAAGAPAVSRAAAPSSSPRPPHVVTDTVPLGVSSAATASPKPTGVGPYGTIEMVTVPTRAPRTSADARGSEQGASAVEARPVAEPITVPDVRRERSEKRSVPATDSPPSGVSTLSSHDVPTRSFGARVRTELAGVGLLVFGLVMLAYAGYVVFLRPRAAERPAVASSVGGMAARPRSRRTRPGCIRRAPTASIRSPSRDTKRSPGPWRYPTTRASRAVRSASRTTWRRSAPHASCFGKVSW